MDRSKIVRIRHEVGELLKSYGIDNKFVIELGNARYDSNSVTIQLKLVEATSKDEAKQIEWNSNCWRYNLKSEDFGKKITFNNKQFTLTGFSRKAKLYPIIATGQDGRSYKLPARAIHSN